MALAWADYLQRLRQIDPDQEQTDVGNVALVSLWITLQVRSGATVPTDKGRIE